jgi:glucose-fructose oxidoreductase
MKAVRKAIVGRGKNGRKARFAVIGQGYFAQAAVLPAFDNADNAELAAIFSEDESKLRALKRKYGVEYALGYDQYDAFLKSGAVDAVYIALPNDMHCAYTVRAARAGVHVLCEKPMAVTSAQCERMIAACQEHHVKLMIAYRLHFEEANLSAIDLIQKGRIGEPRFFSATFAMQVKKENIRTKRARGGGPLHDIGIYCVNAARYFFRAEPMEAVAMAATRKGDDRFREIDEQVSAILRFPGDRLAQLAISFGAYDHSSCSVVGTEGRIKLEPSFDFSTELAWELETAGGKSTSKTFEKRDQVAPELMEFADCILTGRDPGPSGREGLADVRVLEAIARAMETGRRVNVVPVAPERRPSLRQQRKKRAHGMPELIGAEPPAQH